MAKLSYGTLIIMLAGCGEEAETTDHIRGEFYAGDIDGKKLADSVKEVEPSTLTVDFSVCDGDGQCAEINFDGELTVIGITISDSAPQTVHDVVIDGNALFCETEADGYILLIEGTFTDDRAVLDASVSTPLLDLPVFLGAVHLVREELDDTASDTGEDTGDDTG